MKAIGQSFQKDQGVPKAHLFIVEAEKAKREGKWDEAIQYHKQAAELFLAATTQTSNLDAINSLKLLAMEQSSRAQDIERQMTFIRAKNERSEVGRSPDRHPVDVHDQSPVSRQNSFRMTEGSSSPATSEYEDEFEQNPMASSIVIQDSNESEEDRPSDSVNEMLSYYTSPHGLMRRNYSEPSLIPHQRETSFSEINLWSWMERLLELVPIPSNLSNSPSSREKSHVYVNNNSMIDSFVVIHDKDPNLEKDILMKKIQYQEQEISALKERLRQVEAENILLKQAKVPQLEASIVRENQELKKNILQFREEIQKKFHELKQKSPSPTKKNQANPLSASVPNFGDTLKITQL